MDITTSSDSGKLASSNADSKRRYSETPLPNPYAAYNKKAQRFDLELSRDSRETIDTLLVFVSPFVEQGSITAGLFSAVVSTLVSQTTLLLQHDQADYTNQLLLTVIDSLNKQPEETVPKPSLKAIPNLSKAIAVNAALFGSLLLSLLAALAAMLVKQWVRQYELGLHNSVSWQKARKRYKRFQGLRASHLAVIARWIPMLLHFALVFFFCGITVWLFLLHTGLGVMSTVLVGIGAILYFAPAVASALQRDSPFTWPVSTGLSKLVRFLQSLFRALWAREHDGESDSTEIPLVKYSPLKMNSPSARFAPPLYITSPETLYDEKEDQFKPDTFEVDDLRIFMQLLAATDEFKDFDATFDIIRSSQLYGAIDHELLLENAPTILKHCSALAGTCWKQDRHPREVRMGYWKRARRLCRFIEWLYFQLSVQERRQIGPWPEDHFARALYEDSLRVQQDSPEDDEIFEDLVLSSSVIAKLHHVCLRDGESCKHCWDQRKVISRENLCDLVRMHTFKSDPEQRRNDDKEIDLATAVLASDYDCLVNYMYITTTKEYHDLVGSRSDCRKFLMQGLCIDLTKFHFRRLRLHLALLRGALKEDDPRLVFFENLDSVSQKGRDPPGFLERLGKVEANERERLRPMQHVEIVVV
ncbi:hypothetical protein FRC17_000723 [Serendipita sp. 399]|nr:hypothetical protein FRC17_000723 [Serendipita sp. 399]